MLRAALTLAFALAALAMLALGAEPIPGEPTAQCDTDTSCLAWCEAHPGACPADADGGPYPLLGEGR